ncbi:MAG: XdhC family protein [Bacillota bacterium]
MDKDIVSALARVERDEEKVALATVVRSHGSSPRSEGAQMIIWPGGEIEGTVGGGPVEAAIIKLAVEKLADIEFQPGKHHFAMDNEAAADAGGICGGNVDIFLEPIDCTQGGQ